jgi:hypothetical protein
LDAIGSPFLLKGLPVPAQILQEKPTDTDRPRLFWRAFCRSFKAFLAGFAERAERYTKLSARIIPKRRRDATGKIIKNHRL